jgi:photosystem II stability/assembly factor-like uncharacterized protein
MKRKLGIILFISSFIISILSSCTSDKCNEKRHHQTVLQEIKWQPLYEPGSGGYMTGFIVSPHDSKRLLLPGDMLGTGLSADQGKSWQSTFGFKSGEMADATWHPTNPDVVWMGTMSGPYISLDGGLNWQEKRKGMPGVGRSFYSVPIEKILFDPVNNSRLLAFGGSSRGWHSPGKPAWGVVWESLNGGESWKKLSTITKSGSSTKPDAEGLNIQSVSYLGKSAEKLIASVLDNGIYLSNDNGKTWTPSNTGLPHTSTNRLAVHSTNSDIAWVSLNNYKNKNDNTLLPGGVYKTVDGGKTWQNSSNDLSQNVGKNVNYTARYKGLAVSKTNPNVLYTSNFSWNGGILYRSLDGGAHWQAVATKNNIGQNNKNTTIFKVKTAYPPGLGLTTITIDPNNVNTVYGLGSEYVIKSSDGGNTWEDITSTQVDLKKNSWIGSGYSGLCSMNFAFSPNDPNHWILQAMDAGKLWQTFDGGKSWIRNINHPHPWGGGRDLAFAGNNIYVSMGQGGSFMGVGKSTDSGKSWTVLGGKKIGLPELGRDNAPDGIYAVPGPSDKIWLAHKGNLYYSDNAGKSWRIIKKTPYFRWFAGDPNNPLHFYIASKKGVYETHDGLTFNHIEGPEPAGKMTVDKNGILYTTSFRGKMGGLWKYHNKQWQKLLDDKYAYDIAVDPDNPKRLAVCSNDHPYHDDCQAKSLWLSDDGGNSWSSQIKGLPLTRGETITFNPHDHEMLVLGSLGRGFFKTRWPENLQLKNKISYVNSTKTK